MNQFADNTTGKEPSSTYVDLTSSIGISSVWPRKAFIRTMGECNGFDPIHGDAPGYSNEFISVAMSAPTLIMDRT